MTGRTASTLAMAVALLAGCGGAATTTETAQSQNKSSHRAGTPAPAPAKAEAATHPAEARRESGSPSLLLASDGILAGGTPGSRIAFGANSLDTIERVMPLLGERFQQDENAECGAGPMEFANWGKIVLAFQQGEFVGWELREASEEPWVGTPGGVTIGTSRAELTAALGAAPVVEESSLGQEFNAGGFGGLLSSDRPDARVTALWAGVTCFMR